MANDNFEGILKWESSFETGIDRIDFEHKIFLELLNSFKYGINTNMDEFEVIKIITEIEKYAEFHFISEENFMLRIKYPDYKEHQIEHFELLEQFNLSKFQQCGLEEFHKFLKHWFISHTVESDTRLKNFIDSNQIELKHYYYNINVKK